MKTEKHLLYEQSPLAPLIFSLRYPEHHQHLIICSLAQHFLKKNFHPIIIF